MKKRPMTLLLSLTLLLSACGSAGITANGDFTEFTVTSSTEPDMAETFAVPAFHMYGGLYNVFNGKEAENITVNFVNADSGKIIFTSNSSEMGK